MCYRQTNRQTDSSGYRVATATKNRALYLARFNRGSLMKFENTFFQIAKLRFLTIFNNFRQNSEFSKNSQGTSLKARGLIFWIPAFYIHIKAPVKTEFVKSIIWSISRGGLLGPAIPIRWPDSPYLKGLKTFRFKVL